MDLSRSAFMADRRVRMFLRSPAADFFQDIATPVMRPRFFSNFAALDTTALVRVFRRDENIFLAPAIPAAAEALAAPSLPVSAAFAAVSLAAARLFSFMMALSLPRARTDSEWRPFSSLTIFLISALTRLLMRTCEALSDTIMADTTWMSPMRRVSCSLIEAVRPTKDVVKDLRAAVTSAEALARASLMFLTVLEKRESARADWAASLSLRFLTPAPRARSRSLRFLAMVLKAAPNFLSADLRAASSDFSTDLITLL